MTSDMFQWIAQIQDDLAKKKPSLAVATDPMESELGKWLGSAKKGSIYTSASDEFKVQWDRLLTGHNELFETATCIQGNLGGYENLKKALKVK